MADVYNTREKRKRAVRHMLDRLEKIVKAEQQSLDNTPESLRETESFEIGELAIEKINEAIDALNETY